ncbi:hypothetical protein H9P43_009856 [Blastocladiella emersonii ATCC 22665]|nr:hypothetical protein H9P43_009856 [Blastocladiella emersonii ATCC 22665]
MDPSAVLASVTTALAPLQLETRLAPLLTLVRVLGPRKSALLTALATATVLGARFWYRSIRVPPGLRHLPRLSIAQTFTVLTSGAGFFDAFDAQIKLVRADALRRGVIRSDKETPKHWAFWFLGKWSVVTANPEDMKQVFTGHEQFEKFDFSGLTLSATRDFLGDNVALSQTPVWKRQRKVVNPAFRRGWATSIFGPPARVLLSELDKLEAQRTPVDQAAFGTNFNALENPHSDMATSYHTAMAGLANLKLVMLWPFSLFMSDYWAYKRAVAKFNTYIYQLIDAKAAEVAKRRGNTAAAAAGAGEDVDDAKDLLELMVAAGESGGFSREELRANVVIFFIAGHDTTANALTFVLYVLGRNPEIQRKARAEVLALIGDADQGTAAADFPYPTNDAQNRMSYLTCVIKETMRLFPSVCVLPMREVSTDGKLGGGSLEVPAGTTVSAHIYAVHHAREYWGDDADAFRPERWADLGVSTDGAIPLHPGEHDFKWVPFGGGQRICLGQQFSIIEQRVILSMLLLRYEWTVAGNDAALAGRPDVSPGTLLHGKDIFLDLKPHVPPRITSLVARLGGVRVLATAVLVALASKRMWSIYTRVVRVPRGLEHLPRVALRPTLKFLTSGEGALAWTPKYMRLLREDALRRGAIKSIEETPRVWLFWEAGRWNLVLANPDDAKLTFADRQLYDKISPEANPVAASRELPGQPLFLVTYHDWKRQRKVVNPAFRRGWSTTLFEAPTRALLAQLDKLEAAGKPVVVDDWMQRVTLDALTQVALGTSFRTIEDPSGRMLSIYHRVIAGVMSPKFVILAPVARMFAGFRDYARAVKEMNAYLLEVIDAKVTEMQRKKVLASAESVSDDDGRDSRDLLELMIEASEDGTFTREELRSNLFTFILAGHDTTSTALTFAIYLLGMHPEIQARARAEVLSVLPSPNACPTTEAQAKLVYLTRVIKETMRLYPSVAVSTARITTAPAVLSDGLAVPKGTPVLLHTRAMQTAREYWGDTADVFDPDRWADYNLAMTASANGNKWAPFGGGQRACIGAGFSIVEQRVVLAMMLARYEWRVVRDAEAVAGRPQSTASFRFLHAVGIEIELKHRQ